MRERHEDLLLRATRLGDAAEGLFELVLAELELERPDDGDGNTAAPVSISWALTNGERSICVTPSVEPERLLARA